MEAVVYMDLRKSKASCHVGSLTCCGNITRAAKCIYVTAPGGCCKESFTGVIMNDSNFGVDYN